uniref:Wd40 repeat n=1 Tax=Echinococcus granulosus TaxID=6210 RepID=A0A068WG01_ECHGR|nr:wd40 repeat [Echinococcus granulosus]
MPLVDQSPFAIDIPPEITKKSSTSQILQTDPYSVVHRGNQSRRYRSTLVYANDYATEESRIEGLFCDETALHQFLDRVTPIICTHLEQNLRSKAWDRYVKDTYEPIEALSEPILRLNYAPKSLKLCSIDVAWNSTGSVVAVSYGQDFHVNWCTHTAYLALWNVTKSHVDPVKPDYIFETNCCVSSMAFCNEDAPLVAGGTVSGELIIWSLSKEGDSRVAACGCIEGGHQDSVTGIFWISQKDLNTYTSSFTTEHHLVTVGADGRIICWNLQKMHSSVFSLKPVRIYQVTGKDQSSGSLRDVNACSKSSEGLGSEGATHSVGISTATFSPHSTETNLGHPLHLPLFLLGTESGGVLIAHLEVLHWTSSTSGPEFTNALASPVKYVLARYFAPIHCVAWSFSDRNLATVSGAFPGVHIYNILERTRIYTLGTEEGQIFAMYFLHSPSSRSYQYRSLLACGSARGTITVYDLRYGSDVSGDSNEGEVFVSTKRCVLQCRTDASAANPVMCMASSDGVDSLMAVGSRDGTVTIFDTSNVKSLDFSVDTPQY